MLTMDELAELLTEPAPTHRTPTYWLDYDGVVHSGKPPTEHVGAFVGRAGSIRRSRKGRTYHAANGSRKYIISHDSEVLAYKV